MASKVKTTIGLEITCSSEIRNSKRVRLVEIVSSASGMKITNFAVFDYPPARRPSGGQDKLTGCPPHADDKLTEAAINTKEIYGVVSNPPACRLSGRLVEHRIVLLPPMTEQEMNEVTRREASKGGEASQADVSFGFDIVGQIEKGDIKKIAVLIVTAPYELVREQMCITEGMGIRLRGLTVVPLALFHALGQGKECGEEDTIAFIHVESESASIIMVSNNCLLFSREFSLASSAVATETDYTGRLTAEVKRSFLYFKQHYRGKKVSKGILSGDIQDLRNSTALLAKELDIEVDVFGVPDGLKISLPGEKIHEFQSLLPSLAIPIGLAIAGIRQSRVNLLSQEGIRGRRFWRTNTALRIASNILLLMLLGSYLWVSIMNLSTQRTRLTTLKALESLRPELKNISKLQEERYEHAARLLLIERLNSPSPPDVNWSEMLREISWLVPDDMVFNTLEVKPEKGQRERITIKGKAHTKNSFNKFLSYLQNSSSLSVLNSHSGVQELPVGSQASRFKTQDLRLGFVIECEVSRKR